MHVEKHSLGGSCLLRRQLRDSEGLVQVRCPPQPHEHNTVEHVHRCFDSSERLGLIFILFNMIVWARVLSTQQLDESLPFQARAAKVGVGSVWWKAGHLHSAEASLFFDAVCWRDSACCCRSLAYIERALQQKRSHFLQKCLFESPTEVCLAVEKLF